MTTFLFICALIPAALFCFNLLLYRQLPQVSSQPLARVSVLIPARDEELSIAAAVNSVLSSRGIEFEVIVLDDASTDATAEIVRAIASTDARVRLEQACVRGGGPGRGHPGNPVRPRAGPP